MSLTRIPGAQVPVLDSTSGLMSREWYRFLYNLFELTGGGSSGGVTPAELQDEINTLNTEVGGLTATVSTQGDQIANIDEAITNQNVVIAAQQNAIDLVSDAPAQIGVLPQQVQDAQLSYLTASLESLASKLGDIDLGPSAIPYPIPDANMGAGAFYDTNTKTAAAINTAYAITFSNSWFEFRAYRGSPTSRIYVNAAGTYNFQFSAQLDNTSGGNHLAFIWARVNGTDIANSASQVRLKGTDGELVAAWNFFITMAAGDYFELMYSVSDTAVQITAQAAAAPVPAIPSVILTVNQVYSPYGH